MRQKNTTGTDYVYGRIDQDVALAYSHAMGRNIPDYNYYIDAPGETKQLDALLDTVRAGDRVIVGTITDFMLPDIQDMLNTLENLDELDVAVISRLQPDYDIKKYRSAIRLADTICRVKMGKRPV